MNLHKWKTRQNTALKLTTACVACLLFAIHVYRLRGIHAMPLEYMKVSLFIQVNQIATFCSEPAKGGKDAYVLEEKYIGR